MGCPGHTLVRYLIPQVFNLALLCSLVRVRGLHSRNFQNSTHPHLFVSWYSASSWRPQSSIPPLILDTGFLDSDSLDLRLLHPGAYPIRTSSPYTARPECISSVSMAWERTTRCLNCSFPHVMLNNKGGAKLWQQIFEMQTGTIGRILAAEAST